MAHRAWAQAIAADETRGHRIEKAAAQPQPRGQAGSARFGEQVAAPGAVVALVATVLVAGHAQFAQLARGVAVPGQRGHIVGRQVGQQHFDAQPAAQRLHHRGVHHDQALVFQDQPAAALEQTGPPVRALEPLAFHRAGGDGVDLHLWAQEARHGLDPRALA